MSLHASSLRALLVPALVLGLLPAVEAAPLQKVNSRYREFPGIGLEFRSFKDMSDVPVNDDLQRRSIIAQGEAERGPFVKASSGERFAYPPSLYVLFDEPQGPTTGEGSSEEKYEPRTTEDYVETVHGGRISLKRAEGEVEEFEAKDDIVGQRARYETSARTGYGNVEVVLDVYTFFVGQSKLVFVWDYPSEDRGDRKKWEKAIEKSMKSLRTMKEGRSELDLEDINSESSYEDLLEFHQHDVDQTPGWELVETPSKQYLIKTNTEDRKDLKDVIKRLEASRKLYEEDFPPQVPITSISVVRICATRDEFNTYGQTGGGVAGYFNPGSEELVLFFGDGSVKETFGVMTHEAFHQYCHFLFNRSEAHRWFDEGHGDYYGAWELKGKNLKPGKDMRGGLSRVPHLKELLRTEQLAPLSDHIRFNHPQWQGQGPQNISNYCQSFGLIYFLREGTRGKVSRRYWKDEYATIIPNYMKYLYEGYQTAYAEIQKEAQEALDKLEEAKEAGGDVDEERIAELRERIDRPWEIFRFVGDKKAIWDKAMAESWGKIDEKEFEENWLEYVDKEM